jgi:Tfp pilus assembly protein PilN
MRPLRLDFLHPTTPRRTFGVALLAIGVVAAGAGLWRERVISDEIAQLSARIADTKRLARRDLPQVREVAGDPKVVAQEVGRANAILASLTLPWDAMFGELEAAANANVALLGIQPESSGRQVRLVGEARRFEDLLTYISRLEATDGFANVFLAGHEMKQVQAERPVAFSLTATWVGRQ